MPRRYTDIVFSLLMIFIGTYSGAASACSCADMTIEELWEWSDSGALIKPNVFLVEFTRIESTHLGRKGGAYKTAYFKVLETYRGTAEHTPYVSTIFDTMLTNCSRSLPDNLIGEQWILFSGYDRAIPSIPDRKYSPFYLHHCSSYFIGTTANIMRLRRLVSD